MMTRLRRAGCEAVWSTVIELLITVDKDIAFAKGSWMKASRPSTYVLEITTIGGPIVSSNVYRYPKLPITNMD